MICEEIGEGGGAKIVQARPAAPRAGRRGSSGSLRIGVAKEEAGAQCGRSVVVEIEVDVFLGYEDVQRVVITQQSCIAKQGLMRIRREGEGLAGSI